MQYDAMDHSGVNARFVADFLAAHGPCRGGEILDVGTGTARIPIALAQADPQARVLALDLSETMLEQARINIAAAGLSPRIRCHQGDAKSLVDSFGAGRSKASSPTRSSITSPIPAPALDDDGHGWSRRAARSWSGTWRGPDSLDEIARLGDLYAGGESPEAKALFLASLNAALTLDEIRALVAGLGLPAARRRDDLGPALDLDVETAG